MVKNEDMDNLLQCWVLHAHTELSYFGLNPVVGLFTGCLTAWRPTLTSTYSDTYQRLLSALRQARKEAGVTQAQLAVKLEKPQSFVSKYEHGERRLDAIELLGLCRQLGIDPYSLLREVEQDVKG